MKLTTVILILTLFTWINCQSQENKFELGFGVFPNFSLGVVTNDGSTANEILVGYQGMEIAKPSISSNIFVEYKIKKIQFLDMAWDIKTMAVEQKKQILYSESTQLPEILS